LDKIYQLVVVLFDDFPARLLDFLVRVSAVKIFLLGTPRTLHVFGVELILKMKRKD
jgi:hypothetical protein